MVISSPDRFKNAIIVPFHYSNINQNHAFLWSTTTSLRQSVLAAMSLFSQFEKGSSFVLFLFSEWTERTCLSWRCLSVLVFFCYYFCCRSCCAASHFTQYLSSTFSWFPHLEQYFSAIYFTVTKLASIYFSWFSETFHDFYI